MKTAFSNLTVVPFLALCALPCMWGDASASQPPAKQLAPDDQQEYQHIRQRLREHEALLTRASWTLCHCADEAELARIEGTAMLLGAFVDDKQLPKLVEAGGVKAFKEETAGLLKNKDPVVRGYGAIVLAVVGDAAYKERIAKLLEDENCRSAVTEFACFKNLDRRDAARALGLMGAEEYAPRLAALLRSDNENDRTGAASGLGAMGSPKHAAEIARLLDDKVDEVRMSATAALGALGAKQYAGRIAPLLTASGDPMVRETACYTLARLNAKDHARDLARLLGEQFQAGDAAKALAVLGAVEYAKDIAVLLEDKSPLVRCDALIALGILDAKQYTKNVAANLDDKEPFVRAYAAVALLLMGDRTRAKKVQDVVQAEWKDPEIASDDLNAAEYFGAHIKLHAVVSERQRQLTLRAKEAWDRLKQPGR